MTRAGQAFWGGGQDGAGTEAQGYECPGAFWLIGGPAPAGH